MKKVLIVVIAALLIFTMLSSLSMLPEGDGLLSKDGPVNDFIHNVGDGIKDTIDNIIKGDEDDGDSTKEPDSTDDVDVVYTHEQNTFYWFDSSGNRMRSTDISAVPEGTRGYFFSGNHAYFCFKSIGSDSMGIQIVNDSSSFDDDNLVFLLIKDMDMSDESNYENYSMSMEAQFYDHRLIAYAVEDMPCDLIATYEELGNYRIYLQTCDPVIPEGPGAE